MKTFIILMPPVIPESYFGHPNYIFEYLPLSQDGMVHLLMFSASDASHYVSLWLDISRDPVDAPLAVSYYAPETGEGTLYWLFKKKLPTQVSEEICDKALKLVIKAHDEAGQNRGKRPI